MICSDLHLVNFQLNSSNLHPILHSSLPILAIPPRRPYNTHPSLLKVTFSLTHYTQQTKCANRRCFFKPCTKTMAGLLTASVAVVEQLLLLRRSNRTLKMTPQVDADESKGATTTATAAAMRREGGGRRKSAHDRRGKCILPRHSVWSFFT